MSEVGRSRRGFFGSIWGGTVSSNRGNNNNANDEELESNVVSSELLNSLLVLGSSNINTPATNNVIGVHEARSGVSESNFIRFTLNGENISTPLSVDNEHMTLAEFLREECGLTGTKVSCAEGGCGACTVLMKLDSTIDERESQKQEDSCEWLPVNACLRLLGSCHGGAFMTAEGIGGSGKPLDKLQSGLADGCGSQCGFCSPGMVASGTQADPSWIDDFTLSKLLMNLICDLIVFKIQVSH